MSPKQNSILQQGLLAFCSLLLLSWGGCAAEEDGGGAAFPGFTFPTNDEGGDEESGGGEEGGNTGGGEAPKPPQAPAIEVITPDTCMGAGGAVDILATHPDGVATAILMKGEEELLALTTEDGATFVGTLDMSVHNEGPLNVMLVVTSNAGTETTQEITWKVDKTTPTLKWDTPVAATVVSGKAVLEGSAKDTGGCGVAKVESFLNDELFDESFAEEPPEPEVGEDGEPLPYPEVPTDLTFFHTKDTTQDGTFLGTLKVVVTDKGGNTTEDTRVVYVVKPLDMLYAGETLVPGNVSSMVTGFLDDDSLRDVFVSTNAGILAAQSLGKGEFGQWLTIDKEGADLMVAADLDDDGDTDLVSYKKDAAGGKYRVLLQETPGNFVLGQESIIEGDKVNQMRMAEMTGDGIADVVLVTSSGSQSIGVWEGVGGDGQFKPAIKWAGGVENIVDIETGDFNGDQNTDAAVVSSDTNKVSVFLGDGDGGFYAANDTILEESAVSIVPGFFDEDDKLDLVVALSGAQNAKIQFLKGQGNGYFAVSFDMAYGGPPEEVASGDFDSDGLLDVVATMGDRTAAFFYGRDALKGGYRYVLGPDATFLNVGHFTGGDGWNGLGIAALKKLTGSAGSAVVAIGGDGEGFFQAAPVLWNSFKCPGKNYTNCGIMKFVSIVVGQFDLNSGLDVAGVTQAYTEFNIGEEGVYQYDVELFLSEDGFLPNNNSQVQMPLTGYFAFEKWSQKGSILSISTGDFNGDGDADLAIANETGYVKPPGEEGWTIKPENVDILLQQNGAFDPQNVTGAWAGRDAAAYLPDSEAQKQGKLESMTVTDVDGDGRDDLVGVTPYVKDTTNLLPDTPAHLTPWLAYAQSQWLPGIATAVDASAIADPGTTTAVSGDIDLDGRMDLMSVNPGVNNVAVHYGDGLGTFTDGRLFSAVSPGVRVVTLGQLNPDEDDYPDLVSVGGSEVFVTYGREHQQGEDDPFDPPVTLTYTGAQPVGVVTTDLNLDGLEDILVLDESSSTAFLYAGMGERTFSAEPLMVQTSGGAKTIQLADLDEDGCLDVVILATSGVTLIRNQTCDNGGAPPTEEPPAEEGGETAEEEDAPAEEEGGEEG